jgi:hypothetical protein
MNTSHAHTRVLSMCAIVLSMGLFAACASKGADPVAELATAKASVSQAESAGAKQLAPVEFLAAQEKLAKAESASRAKEYVYSKRMAESATADADLAERKSRAAKATQTAEELERANAALRNEATRKP